MPLAAAHGGGLPAARTARAGRRRRSAPASRSRKRASENICASSERSCRCCSVACSGTSSTKTWPTGLPSGASKAIGELQAHERARALLQALDAAVRNRDALARGRSSRASRARAGCRRRSPRTSPRLRSNSAPTASNRRVFDPRVEVEQDVRGRQQLGDLVHRRRLESVARGAESNGGRSVRRRTRRHVAPAGGFYAGRRPRGAARRAARDSARRRASRLIVAPVVPVRLDASPCASAPAGRACRRARRSRRTCRARSPRRGCPCRARAGWPRPSAAACPPTARR